MARTKTRNGVPRRAGDERLQKRLRIERPRFTQAGRRTPRHGHHR